MTKNHPHDLQKTQNYYDYHDSSHKTKAVLGDCSPKFLVPGHEPSLLVTGVE